MVERLLVCLLARGHCLLEGVPGLAKTLAAETLAATVHGHVRPHPVHSRPDAVRPRRHADLPPVDRALRRRARPDLRQLRARRRDQPRAGQGAVGAARGHGRAPGVDRRRHAPRCPTRSSCSRRRTRSSRRACTSLPEAQRDRFLHEGRRRVPDADGGARDRQPDGRRPADARARARRRRAARAAAPRRRGLRRSRGHLVRGEPRVRDTASPSRPGLRRPRTAHRVRRQPPCHARARRGRPRAGVDPRPHLRAAAGRVRRRARGAAPPDRAVATRRWPTASRPTTGRPHRHRDPAARGSRPSQERVPGTPASRSRTRHRATLPEPRGNATRRSALHDPRHVAGRPRAEVDAAPPRARRVPPSRRPAPGRPPRARARAGHRGGGEPRVPGPATTSGAWTGRSPRAPPCRTSATPSPTASSRRGSSSTARPASTSAPRECEKRDLALATVAAVGFLTSRVGNRVGALILTADDRTVVVPRSAGRDATFALLHRIDGVPASRRRPPAGRRPAPTRCARVATLARRRGLVVVISDFLDQRRRGSRPLRALAARHDVLAVEIVDPRELELPPVGPRHPRRHRDRPPGRGADRERAGSGPASPRPQPSSAPASRAASRGAGAEHLVLRTDRDWLLDSPSYVDDTTSPPRRPAAPRRVPRGART